MAVRFHYPFQKVVDLKESEKTQAEWMLSATIGKLQKEEHILSGLVAEKEKTLLAIQQASVACASMSDIQQMQSYLGRLEARIQMQHRAIQTAKLDVKQKQEHLTVKMRDEKVWLQARDKAKERFQYEMLLREQNELDEIATVRFSFSAR